VVFVREIVPLRLVKWLARLLYNEPYIAMPLSSTVTESADSVTIEHRLTGRDRTHTIRATGTKPGFRPGPETVEHFFKEHHWGYGQSRRGKTLGYEVLHAVWDVYQVREYQIAVNWAALYGPEWAFLQNASPASTILAMGSPVAVFPHGNVMKPCRGTPSMSTNDDSRQR
jgi:hypothetical protein